MITSAPSVQSAISTVTADKAIIPLTYKIGDSLDTFMRRNALEDKDTSREKWIVAKQAAFKKAQDDVKNQTLANVKMVAKFNAKAGKWMRSTQMEYQKLATNDDRELIHSSIEKSKVQNEKSIA